MISCKTQPLLLSSNKLRLHETVGKRELSSRSVILAAETATRLRFTTLRGPPRPSVP